MRWANVIMRSPMKTLRAYVVQMKRLPLIMLVAVVSRDAHALSVVRCASFEEVVNESTDIFVGNVLSVSQRREHFRMQREYTLRILRTIKGAETNAEITVHQHDYITRGDANPVKGGDYVVFLLRAPGDNKYSQQFATPITQDAFLDAIKSEMCRTSKPLPHEFLGIRMGDSIQKAEASSGLQFTHYRDTYDTDGNWDRYYTFMPTNREEHMVQMNVRNGNIVHLSVYYHEKNHAYLKTLLRDTEGKCGGTPLDEMGDLSFSMGRRWADADVEIRLGGPFNTIKANGFPWGVLTYYELAVSFSR